MIFKVILDTNVIVSFALWKNPKSSIGLLREIVNRKNVKLLYSDSIIKEYREVLTRPKFGFDPLNVQNALMKIAEKGERVEAEKFFEKLSDPKDEDFYYLALTVDDSFLVTGNLKHFPRNARIVSPREFVEIYDNNE